MPAVRAKLSYPNQFSEYDGVPPEIDNTAVPLLPPKQFTFVLESDTEISLGSKINKESLMLHPFVSIKVKKCMPYDNARGLLKPQFCEYGPTPPKILIIAFPSLNP